MPDHWCYVLGAWGGLLKNISLHCTGIGRSNLLGVDWDTLETETVTYESGKRQPFSKVFLITIDYTKMFNDD